MTEVRNPLRQAAVALLKKCEMSSEKGSAAGFSERITAKAFLEELVVPKLKEK